VERGVVVCWEDVERLWAAGYRRLGASAREHPVLVTEAPLGPKANREQMVQMLFEDFGVPAVHVAVSGVLSLYSTGSKTGLVVESGDGVSSVMPIYDDFVLPHAVMRLDLGGSDLTDYLVRLLRAERGYSFATAPERRAAVAVKEQLCYVAENFAAELYGSANVTDLDQSFALPDQNVIVAAGTERFRAPEALFQPSLLGQEVPGLHEMAQQSLRKCETDMQRGLLGRVVLTGGTMLFRGMRERVQRELQAAAPSTLTPSVSVPEAPQNAAFAGASIISSLSSFGASWISRADYEECGAAVIHSRSLSLTEAHLRKDN